MPRAGAVELMTVVGDLVLFGLEPFVNHEVEIRQMGDLTLLTNLPDLPGDQFSPVFGSLFTRTVIDDPSLTTGVGSGKVYAPVVIMKYRKCRALLGSVTIAPRRQLSTAGFIE
jgi:hypothetical protein